MSRSVFSSHSHRYRRGQRGGIPPWLWLVFAAVLVVADRLTKLAVTANMQLNEDFPVLGPFLHFYYLRNSGAAFSMFQNLSYGRWILVGFTVALVCVCVWVLLAGKMRTRLGNLALTLIVAGGVGNLIDRVRHGEVVDFLYVKIINFAIFNVADSFVVVGAVLLCLSFLLQEEWGRR
ncbi:signal peptidase II [Ethanoligenens sp.]|uniref:signal peptidase II n=1 Tax=Ethanoligenens sp. TaxID=2099655 RepID=UPI0039E9C051